LTDLEIEDALKKGTISTSARLVRAAYQRSQQKHFWAKPDNISAIVVCQYLQNSWCHFTRLA
jgi:hypothetical protein